MNAIKYTDNNGIKWNPWINSLVPTKIGIKYNWPKTKVSLDLFNVYLTDLVKRHNNKKESTYNEMVLTKKGHFSFKRWGLKENEKSNKWSINSYIILLDEKNNYIELMINDTRGSCIIYSQYDNNTTPEIFDINTGILVGWQQKIQHTKDEENYNYV